MFTICFLQNLYYNGVVYFVDRIGYQYDVGELYISDQTFRKNYERQTKKLDTEGQNLILK